MEEGLAVLPLLLDSVYGLVKDIMNISRGNWSPFDSFDIAMKAAVNVIDYKNIAHWKYFNEQVIFWLFSIWENNSLADSFFLK